MKNVDCLLTAQNTFPCGATTVGALIAQAGKEHLWQDRDGPGVDTVVIHYISACEIDSDCPWDLELIFSILCKFGVSAHVLILRDGTLLRLVPTEKKAWHCGAGIMPEPDNRQGINDFSIGIELVATHTSGFTNEQYASAAHYCEQLRTCYKRSLCFVGHDTVAGERAVALGLRNVAKTDPGPFFDWLRFHELLSSQPARVDQ